MKEINQKDLITATTNLKAALGNADFTIVLDKQTADAVTLAFHSVYAPYNPSDVLRTDGYLGEFAGITFMVKQSDLREQLEKYANELKKKFTDMFTPEGNADGIRVVNNNTDKESKSEQND